jgi:hypothetical protein
MILSRSPSRDGTPGCGHQWPTTAQHAASDRTCARPSLRSALSTGRSRERLSGSLRAPDLGPSGLGSRFRRPDISHSQTVRPHTMSVRHQGLEPRTR